MATSLSDLRTLTRIELRDPDGYTFVDADVDYAINQAYRKAFQRVANALQDYFVTTTLHSLVAGQREYALPSDHLRTKMFEYVRNDVTIPMKRRRRAADGNYTSGSLFNAVNEQPDFDFEGDNFVIEPTPQVSESNVIKQTYYQTYTKLENDSDNINTNFKDMWIDVVVLDAAWALHSQVESLGGKVSTDIKDRLKDARDVMDKSLKLRSLSPIRRRRRGYFQ